MIIGSHVSLKAPDYFLGSIKEMLSYGANACMIYTGAPSNTRRVDLDRFKLEQANKLLEEHSISRDHIIVHAPYLINLANTVNPSTAEFGRDFLISEYDRVHKMNLKTLVLHPGSHLKQGEEVGIHSIVDNLKAVLSSGNNEVKIALETMAGKGSEIGKSFEELAQIIHRLDDDPRLGICLDTCHLHDAGYDLHNFDEILMDLDKAIGMDRLFVMHINDSKNPRGARKDRHANIGQGYIGFETLHGIVLHTELKNVPKILETPYIDGKAPYKAEIEMLKKAR